MQIASRRPESTNFYGVMSLVELWYSGTCYAVKTCNIFAFQKYQFHGIMITAIKLKNSGFGEKRQ